MSVVGTKVIFCEGRGSSLDSRLLNRIVDALSGPPTIVPAGSKFTFSVFAQGYFFPDEADNQQYIVFRDRDFDALPTPNSQLLQLDTAPGQGYIVLTHRACVENYFFEADLIHSYWVAKYEEKQENPTSRWGHGDSPGMEAIAAWIETSAKTITAYQAVRWALSDLLRISGARAQLRTTWTRGSGTLPDSLDLNVCQSEAIELIRQFQEATGKVTQDSFESSLEKYENQFDRAEFWAQRQYLIWFHGKDLQKSMQRQEPHYISLADFFNSDLLIAQFDITRHDDLLGLRTRIEQL